MDSVTKKRGGSRQGAGRKPESGTGEAMKLRSIRMTDAEWQSLLKLGGSVWIRNQIAIAAAPPADTRPDFEKHFTLSIRQAQKAKNGEDYINEQTQARWEGWQAAKGETK